MCFKLRVLSLYSTSTGHGNQSLSKMTTFGNTIKIIAANVAAVNVTSNDRFDAIMPYGDKDEVSHNFSQAIQSYHKHQKPTPCDFPASAPCNSNRFVSNIYIYINIFIPSSYHCITYQTINIVRAELWLWMYLPSIYIALRNYFNIF